MYKKTLILIAIFFLLSVSGCSIKRPITWDKRVLHSKIEPVNLVYKEYGKEHNQSMLFLHGFGESQYTWRFLLNDLSKKYHLYTIDLKGFGESPKTDDDDYSVYDQAILVEQFMQQHQIRNTTIVGRSFGGGVALVLALMQNENCMEKKIDRLILINSMSYSQRLPSMLRDLKTPIFGFLGIHLLSSAWIVESGYKYAFFNDELIPKESLVQAEKMLSMPLAKSAYLKSVHCLIPDDIKTVEKKYKDILLPTLILWGEKDVSIHVDMAKRLHKELVNSRLKIFKNTGHMPQEERPKEVLEEIGKFMEATPPHYR
jgi:pimeloyl-ACP methyl ester carboxylesterase